MIDKKPPSKGNYYSSAAKAVQKDIRKLYKEVQEHPAIGFVWIQSVFNTLYRTNMASMLAAGTEFSQRTNVYVCRRETLFTVLDILDGIERHTKHS